MFRRLVIVLALLAVGATVGARAADWPGAWLQYGATGATELRAVTPPGLPCPAMTAEGKPLEVRQRGMADAAYPIQVCVAVVPEGARPGAWLLTHRPVWALAQFPNVPAGTDANATLQGAIRGLTPPTLDMVLSGHVHDFTSYDFGPRRPAQLVVGESGTSNDPIAQPLIPGMPIDGLAIRKVFGFADYGYLVLDRVASGWNGTVHGLDDAILARCRLRGRAVECGAARRPGVNPA